MNKRSVFGIIFVGIVISFLLAALAVGVSAYDVGDRVPLYCNRCNQIVGWVDVNDSYQCSDILSYCNGHENSHVSSGWSYDHLEYDNVGGACVSCDDPLDSSLISPEGYIYICYRKNENWHPLVNFLYRQPGTTGEYTSLYQVGVGDSGKLKSLPTPPSYSGYQFNGWTCSGISGYVTLDTVFSSDNDSYTCYADYSAVSLPVVSFYYIPDGSSDYQLLTTVQTNDGYNLSDMLPTCPDRTGYSFHGWYIDGTETFITDTTQFDRDTSVKASYVSAAVNYTITFDFGDGTTEKRIITAGNAIGSLPDHTWKDYVLVGYTTVNADSSTMIDANFVPEGSMTLYAYWDVASSSSSSGGSSSGGSSSGGSSSGGSSSGGSSHGGGGTSFGGSGDYNDGYNQALEDQSTLTNLINVLWSNFYSSFVSLTSSMNVFGLSFLSIIGILAVLAFIYLLFTLIRK